MMTNIGKKGISFQMMLGIFLFVLFILLFVSLYFYEAKPAIMNFLDGMRGL